MSEVSMNVTDVLLQALAIVFSVFPMSFVFFAMSERMLNLHQSRVGAGESFSTFFTQMLRNHWNWIRRPAPITEILILSLMLSLLVLVPFTAVGMQEWVMPGGLYVILFLLFLVSGVQEVMAYLYEQGEPDVVSRVGSDRRSTLMMLGVALAGFAVLPLFGELGGWSVSVAVLEQSTRGWSIFWSPAQPIAFLLFQIGGMLLFGEHPFSSRGLFLHQGAGWVDSRWMQSCGFFIWCVISASLFFGGGILFAQWIPVVSFFVHMLKAGLVYLLFRQASLYFPQMSQKQTLRATLLLWLPVVLAMVVFVWIFRMIFAFAEMGYHV